MSNHSGSYILNEVLNILDNEYDFFKGKEPREIVDFFRKIDNIGNSYDTNTGEILEEIGQKYNICYICMLPVKELPENGVCLYCEYEDQEAKSKSIELNMEELTIEEIANQKRGHFNSTNYVITHNPTGYKTTKYSRKNDALDEIRRYLNNEILENY